MTAHLGLQLLPEQDTGQEHPLNNCVNAHPVSNDDPANRNLQGSGECDWRLLVVFHLHLDSSVLLTVFNERILRFLLSTMTYFKNCKASVRNSINHLFVWHLIPLTGVRNLYCFASNEREEIFIFFSIG